MSILSNLFRAAMFKAAMSKANLFCPPHLPRCVARSWRLHGQPCVKSWESTAPACFRYSLPRCASLLVQSALFATNPWKSSSASACGGAGIFSA